MRVGLAGGVPTIRGVVLALGVVGVVAVAGCAAANVDGGAPGSASDAVDSERVTARVEPETEAEAETDVAGRGSLRQDEFTVSLRSGALLVKITPLAESVIELAAPDTYRRLHALAEARRERAARLARTSHPPLFLVSFFSYEPDTRFRADDLVLENRGRLLRPVGVLPVTPGWGRERLEQQETQTAVYVFEAGIDLDQPMTVRYGGEWSDAWNRMIRRLQAERARLRTRRSRERGEGL